LREQIESEILTFNGESDSALLIIGSFRALKRLESEIETEAASEASKLREMRGKLVGREEKGN
jgi:hypothetical protein